MARRPKERLRTIQLDADVSEIAQRLADKKELSSTLSELLRVNYGFGDAIEEKKRELTALLDYKHSLIEQEQELVDLINKMEAEYLHRESNVKPVLQDKLVKLDARIKLLKLKRDRAVDANERRAKSRGIEQLELQMQQIRSQLIEFDSEGVL